MLFIISNVQQSSIILHSTSIEFLLFNHMHNNDHLLDLNRSENKLPREKLSVTWNFQCT